MNTSVALVFLMFVILIFKSSPTGKRYSVFLRRLGKLCARRDVT